MTDRRPLGLPVFTSSAEDADPPATRRRLPVERGDMFLPSPSPEMDAPPSLGRRTLAAGGLPFSAPDQPLGD